MFDQATLRKLQLCETEILDEVHRICELNNIRYCLIAGSLLGAIRHSGFIPWDDDIDIAMPRYDYERFLKLAQTQLDPKYTVQNIKTEKNLWMAFTKIRMRNSIFETVQDMTIKNTNKGIFIDIFPLDNAKKEKSPFQTVQATLVKGLVSLLARKRGATMKTRPPLLVKVMGVLTFPFTVGFLAKILDWIMKWNSNDDSLYCVNLASTYPYRKDTNLKEKYFPAVKTSFEGRMFFIPKESKYLLARIIGEDYMTLPPIDKRITHEPVQIKFIDE